MTFTSAKFQPEECEVFVSEGTKHEHNKEMLYRFLYDPRLSSFKPPQRFNLPDPIAPSTETLRVDENELICVQGLTLITL
jgi:hypothetical protein